MSKMRTSAIEQVKVSDLRPLERNVRRHPEHQVKALEASIRDFGFLNPVIINARNEVLVGNARTEAAKRAGVDVIPAIRVKTLTPDQERAYIIIENKLTEEASWNYELLNSEIEAIGMDMERYGFDNFLNDAATGEEEGRDGHTLENEEISLDMFGDEEFAHECEVCGFRFN